MKKIFTLATLLVLAMTVNAQGYRKWDFTNWSAATVANLQAEALVGVTGGNWSDIEKKDGTTPGGGVCFWSYANNVDDEGNLMANGVVIPETEGLVWNTAYSSRRSLAIAVNYPSTSLGEYAGPQYLWLGGGNAKSASARLACFTIPKVRIGQKITITAESHKPSDARGVSLFVNDCTDDANQIGSSFTPTAQDTYTWEEGWTLPEGVTVEGETVDVVVYNTNGCHLYSIEVGDNTQKYNVGYLYNGTISEELAYQQISSDDRYTVTPVEATAAFTMDQITAFDAVVISSTLSNADAIASLKDIQPFVPTLNLNPTIYSAWGYGEVSGGGMFASVPASKTGHALFKNIELIDDENPDIKMLHLTTTIPYSGLSLTNYFTADDTLAVVYMDENNAVAIHAHNMSHNGYIYLPYTQENLSDAANPTLLNNAIMALTNTKAKVSAAPAPSFQLQYKDKNTNVIIKSSVPQPQIFYTLDGSEPTEESTLYTEPINISTEGVTVKAVVKGDGYLLSEVGEQAVDLKNQAAAPVINVEQALGKAVVTLSCATEGVDIYYNFDGNEVAAKSSVYAGPIRLMTNQTVTAFALSESYVQSESASQAVTVENPVTFTETLAHMDANKEEFYDAPIANGQSVTNDSKVAYFFSWGKSKTAYPYYDTTADPISTEIDPETGDEINVYPKNAEEIAILGNGWGVRSRGQIVCTEITIKPGTDLGVSSSYNPATVEEFEFADYPVSNFYVNIGEWNTSDPRSGMIFSTNKFKGPFAILSYISNGNSSDGPQVVFESGQDIEGDAVDTEWKQIGDTCKLVQGQRLYKKFVRIYEGTDEVYIRTRIAAAGSKAGFYDIYVLALDPSYLTGIQEVKAEGNQTTDGQTTGIYSLNGIRHQSMTRGLNIVRNADGTVKKVMVK